MLDRGQMSGAGRKAFLLLGILVLFSAPGGGHPRTLIAPVPQPAVNVQQLEQWLRTWQPRLQLKDWRIRVQIVRSHKLEPDTLGNVNWDSVHRRATILVMDPADYHIPAADVPADMEKTVVHELLHLRMAALNLEGRRREETEEEIVEQLAGTLLDLAHQRNNAELSVAANARH